MNPEPSESSPGPYRSAILDHNRAPRRRGRLAAPSCSGDGHNALCGDQIRVELALDGGRIVDYAFEAEACAIVVATASMLGDAVLGSDREEVKRIDADLRLLLDSPQAAPDADRLERLGELADLAEMRALPRRHRCVTLALEALSDALQQ